MNNKAMIQHIGVKVINAMPMTRQEYNDFRGWALPSEENGADEGFLVEYVDGGKANTDQFKGYVSWSPKDVFEKAYRPMEGMTFGMAIEALKQGLRVARKGWNGKGMWLSLSGHAGGSLVHYSDFWSTNNAAFAASQPDESAVVLPSITMKTADDKILIGWLASQTDMLAQDWLAF